MPVILGNRIDKKVENDKPNKQINTTKASNPALPTPTTNVHPQTHIPHPA